MASSPRLRALSPDWQKQNKVDLMNLTETKFNNTYSVENRNVKKIKQARKDRELDIRDTNLPGINERLGHLRPSRELLEYYRKKIAEYDDEHDQLVCKLEEYKVVYEEQHTLQWELRQREEEIVELQKALSDMQIYLFQEREHVLRLYAENDRLKIQELEDKKKIQKLLSLGSVTDGEVTYFLKEPPAKAVIEQKIKQKPQTVNQNNSAVPMTFGSGAKEQKKQGTIKRPCLIELPEERYAKENEMLTLQVVSLQAQLAEQARLAKDQLEAVLEDRRVKDEEYETRRQRDEEKIRTLTEKLHKTQDLLYDSTKDFLELRFEGRAMERLWMAEKDRLLQEMDVVKQQAKITMKEAVLNTSAHTQADPEEMKSLEFQLSQSNKLADNYREQVIQLEDELSRLREEGDVTREVFQDRNEKVSNRLKLMNSRYHELERRRNLEREGFRSDIKNLRTRLRDVEKQLYKVTLGLTDDMDFKRPDDIDMQVLTNVRRTAGRSKKLAGELKNLKSKIYSLENDLKHL